MKNLFEKLKDRFFNTDKLTIRLVIVNYIACGGIASGIVSLIICLLLGIDMIQIIAIALSIIGISIGLYMANWKDQIKLACIMFICLITLVLFPVMFFTGGGVYSGMGLWFGIGMLFSFLLLDGISLYIMLALQILVIVGCYAVGYYVPETVIKMESEIAVSIDMLQSIFLLAFGIGIIIRFQSGVYKKTMEQLKQARQEAEESNKAKSAFLAQMSHEIRTPINAVLGMNEMILRESNQESVLEYAGNAYNAGNALLSIINDILDISKIEAGKLEIAETEYELHSLVSDCYLMTAERAKKKGLELTVDCDEKLPSKLKGDMFHIRQIAVNFLTNAVKYTDSGSVRLKFSGMENDGVFSLCISVKDTGIGLTDESKAKLFGSFQRFELERNQFVEGTGLGLSICKQLSDLMGGTIEVQSVHGEGSEFICTIPQEVTDSTPVGKIQPERTGAQISTAGTVFTAPEAAVLVVDDIEMNLLVFSSLLKRNKMKIDTALSGKLCLEMIQKKKYDIIFMDHMMPEMSGIETFAKMKETEHLNTDTPVVMLTANAIAGEKEKYLSEGFASYLTKPLQADKLEKTLLRYISDEKIICGKDGKTDEQTDRNPGRLVALKEAALDFDPAVALKNCGGDEDFYIELLKDFNIPKKIAELGESLSQKDWERYERLIHTVKGSMRTFGFPELGNIAEALQKAAEEHDENYIVQNHNKAAELLSKIDACVKKTQTECFAAEVKR